MASIEEMREAIKCECSKHPFSCFLNEKCVLLGTGAQITTEDISTCGFADKKYIEEAYKILKGEKMNSEIKTFADVPLGSIVEIEDGTRYMYVGKSKDFNAMTDEYMCLSKNGFQGFLSNFKTELGTDIKTIYKPYGYGFGFNGCIEKSNEVIWQREEPVKEVTMAEVEEKFGCKVKIIKGENK